MHCGGACNVKAFLCIHCAYNGNSDLMSFQTGDDCCDICKHNDQVRCNHIAVCDDNGMEQQYKELIDCIVANNRCASGKKTFDIT